MKITRLEMENFKRIKAVDITPVGNAVVIGGRNAQGKTSVLDGIMAALAGKKGAKDLSRPIRDGESKASVVVELDDLVVTRKWTQSGSTVTVSPKGSTSKLTSPQAILDKLIGALAFDPLAFAESDAKAQVETIIDLVGREQFDLIAAQRREAYDLRTDVNRDIKSLRARIDALGPDVGNDTQPIDVARLSIELEAAIEVEAARQQWEAIEERIADLRKQQDNLAEKAQAVVNAVHPRASGDVREEMKRVDEINRLARIGQDYKVLRADLDEADRESTALTGQIEASDNAKATLIARAALPVDGLAFDEDGVTFNGVPFQQSSAAERLKVSVAMAMAMNPDLRVICIRDASLLDDDSKRALVALAEQHDYQIWLEVVGDGVGESGVVIEDGAVQA